MRGGQQTRLGTAGASHYFQWQTFYSQKDVTGQELMVEHEKFFGVNFLKLTKYTESCYALVVPKALKQTASAGKLHCPAQN